MNPTEFAKDVSVPRPEDVVDRPTLSLHVMARNAENCIGQTISHVAPYLDDVVLVAHCCTDGTVEEARKAVSLENARRGLVDAIAGFGAMMKDIDFKVVPVTPELYPDIHFPDLPESYKEGQPLAGETMPYQTVIGARLLGDWSAARNLGWDLCTSDWRLFLDAGDVVADPWVLPGLTKLLEENNVELAKTRYIHGDGSEGLRERLSRRLSYASGAEHQETSGLPSFLASVLPSGPRWHGPIHETLTSSPLTAHVEGSLLVTDSKPAPGAGARDPGRNFKVAYKWLRERNWEGAPHLLIHMLLEARHCPAGEWCSPGMKLKFCEAIAARLEDSSSWGEQRALAATMLGEVMEEMADFSAGAGSPALAEVYLRQAAEAHEAALDEHVGPAAACRLARVRYLLEDWEGCRMAYALATVARDVRCVLDSHPMLVKTTKILASDATSKTGRILDALGLAREVLVDFPGSSHLREFVRDLESKAKTDG